MPPKKPKPKPEPERDTVQLPRTEEEKQLEKECRSLKKLWDRERFLLQNFQNQKDLMERYWHLERRNGDSAKMELRGKFRLKGDLEERQGYELRLYQEKLKHLLYEQQANTSDIRISTEVALGEQQDDHRAELQRIHEEARALLVRSKDMSSKFQELTLELRKEHEDNIMKLRESIEGGSDNTRLEYENKMREFRTQADAARRAEIQTIEKRLGDHAR